MKANKFLQSLQNNVVIRICIMLMILFSGFITAKAQTTLTIPCNTTAFGAGGLTSSGVKSDPGSGSMNINTIAVPAAATDGYATFNLSAIPAGSVVSSVTVVFFTTRTNAVASIAYNITGTSSNFQATAGSTSLYSAIQTATNLSTATWSNTAAGASNSIALNAAANTLVQTNAGGTISLGFYTSGSTTRVYTIAGETSANPPQIIVVFTAPTCLGTPAAGGAISPVSATVNQCTAFSQAFTLPGYTLAGETYQWQVNTGSGFIAVPGATNATFTQSVTTPSTTVNCIVGCAAFPGSTVTSATATVNGSSPYFIVTSASPYFEGFEASWITQCSAGTTSSSDDVPDSHWLNTPVTGKTSWRRDDDGNSANWPDVPTYTPTLQLGAYAPQGSNANGASSSFSATFSDYSAANNTSGTLDVYLDLSAPGTKQISFDYINASPSGSTLKTLLSTNGPTGTFTAIGSTLSESNNWETIILTTTTTSSTCVLRFLATSDFGVNNTGIDNVAAVIVGPCSGAPAAGTVSASAVQACPTSSITLSLLGTTLALGLTYQWQSSANNTTFIPIAGATNATYNFTGQTTSTYYNCIVSCGSNSATSNAKLITETPCYCTPTFADNAFECYVYTTGVAGGGLNYAGSTCTPANPINQSASVQTGVGTSFTVTNSITGGGCAVWVDFNNDGDFTDAGELITSQFTNSASTYNFTMTVPTTVPTGTYRMRVISIESSNGTTGSNGSGPCGAFGLYGSYEDFTLNVQGAVITASPTTLSGFSADACGVSALQVFGITGQFLSGAGVTVTAPTGFEVSQSGFSYTSSVSIIYGGTTLSSNVDVKFDPTVAGPIAGNITVSGGGIVTPITIAVSGIANGLKVDSTTVNFGNATEGVPSLPKVDTLRGYNLSFPDVAVATSSNSDFQVSSNGTTWGATCNIQITGAALDAPIYTRVTPSALGAETPAVISITYGGTACPPFFTATANGAAACVAPTAPAGLFFTNTGTTGTTVNFTPESAPDGYLLVQSLVPFAGTTTNGTAYTVGNTVGTNGTVVANIGSAPTPPFNITSQVSAPINPNTTYYITVIAYTGGATGVCGGGPVYATSYLSGNFTTCPAQPSGPTATTTNNSITINWPSSSGGGASGITYTLQVSDSSDFAPTVSGAPFTVNDNPGGTVSKTITGINPNTIYYYSIAVNQACTVTATTGQATTTCDTATITVTPAGTQTACLGTGVTLTATSSVPLSSSITWVPSSGVATGGLSLDSTGVSVVATPTVPTSYTVKGNDIYGCPITTAINAVTLSPISISGVAVSPVAANACASTPATLVASGATLTQYLPFFENFNEAGMIGSVPTGWTVDNTGSATTVAWQVFANGTVFNSAVHSPDTSQFVGADNGIAGATATKLVSPVFSTVGLSADTLVFQTFYKPTSSSDNLADVEYTINGGATWTPIATYTNVQQGSVTVFLTEFVGLPASAMNVANVQVRFNYISNNGKGWAIDNVRFKGTAPAASPTYTWSPATGLYTDPGLTQPYTSGNNATTVYAAPIVATPYTVAASVSGVCASTAASNVSLLPTGTWLGGISSDWSNPANWNCNTVPSATSTVMIAANAPNMPSIGSGTYTVSTLSLPPNTTLAIAGGATLNVTGALADTGAISGAGLVVLNGTGGTQNLTGNGYISNLTVSNSATILTPDTIKITGTLTMTAGTLTTNNELVLASTASGTASIAAITGGSIFGNVIVQQYIPGNRAFRFFGHPFSTPIPLSQLQTGFDITGQGSGFNQTGSNNPSAFWYNPVTGDGSTVNDSTGWIAFTSTNGSGLNAWKQYEGIRVLVRGTPGQGLNGAGYAPSATTMSMSGSVNQGPITEQMIAGDTSGYNLLSNPYPSPTDIGTVINVAAASMSGSLYWVWNVNAAIHGAYVPKTIGSGSYYIPANSSFVVNSATGGSLTFAETNKGATASTPLFKLTGNMNNGVTLHLYDSAMHPWDLVYISFNNNASNNIENYDGRHLHNADLDFYSLSTDNKLLSLDARPYITGQVISLGITTDIAQKYIIKAEDFSLSSNEEVYLHDKYLNQYQQLQDGSQYTFSITSDPASQGNDRFELSMAGTATTGINNVSGSNGLKVSMVPNPATEQVTISYEAPKNEKTSVRIMNMAGQQIINMELGDEQKGSVVIPLHNVASGMYMVELISGSEIVTQRLVKQ